jgi:hypothetical protein
MIPPDEFATKQTLEKLSAGCETMKRLLVGLLDSKGKVAEEVHAIRKLGKSLRGGFSLFRLEKSSALEIQAIGRLLSGPRDAVSRFNTWNKLAWENDPLVSSAIRLLLEQQTHSAARRPPPETIHWCVARVNAALGELQELPVRNLPGILGKGLKKLKRRALKRCKNLDHRSERDFHETRKALKALLGAAAFLPEGTVSVDPQLHDLAELLGDENDLATLSVWLGNHGFTKRFTPDLWKTLAAARRKIQKQVIRDVAKFPRGQAK